MKTVVLFLTLSSTSIVAYCGSRMCFQCVFFAAAKIPPRMPHIKSVQMHSNANLNIFKFKSYVYNSAAFNHSQPFLPLQVVFPCRACWLTTTPERTSYSSFGLEMASSSQEKIESSETEQDGKFEKLIKQFYHGSYSLQDRSEFIWAYLSMPYSSCRVVQLLLQTSSNTKDNCRCATALGSFCFRSCGCHPAASAAGCCCSLSIVEILLFGNWKYICLESKWPRCCHTRLKLKKCRDRWWLSTDFSYCLTCSFYL